MLNCIDFLKSWTMSLDQNHHKWGNCETQSSTNQTPNDETLKKSIIQKKIQWMRVKIK